MNSIRKSGKAIVRWDPDAEVTAARKSRHGDLLVPLSAGQTNVAGQTMPSAPAVQHDTAIHNRGMLQGTATSPYDLTQPGFDATHAFSPYTSPLDITIFEGETRTTVVHLGGDSVNLGMSLFNYGSLIISTASYAVAGSMESFWGLQNNAVIENHGLIQVTSPGYADGIVSGSYLPKIWNTATGRILVSGADAYGVESFAATSPIVNDGLIRVTASNDAAGMLLENSSWHITNNGTLEVHGKYGYQGGVGTWGIYMGSGNDTVINTGVITVTADLLNDQCVAIQWWDAQLETIVNSGTITAGIAILGQTDYYASGGGGSSITNSGIINGRVEPGFGDDTLTNSGTINGDVVLAKGNDTFDSEHGTVNGLVDGGEGNNTIVCNRSDATSAIVFAAPADSSVTITLPDGTHATKFQNFAITSGSGNDTLTGGAGTDRFEGGAGNDALSGGAGNDTVVYAHASSGVTVDLSLTTAQSVGGGQGTDTLSGFENVVGSDYADTLRGTSGANKITTGGGDDTIFAGDGDDTIYMGENLTTMDHIDGGAGIDTVFLQGDYAQGIVISHAMLTGVETINLGTDDTTQVPQNSVGYIFKVTTTNDLVAAGQTVTLNAKDYGLVNGLIFDGSAETDGNFNIVGSNGNDTITLGSGDDTVDVYTGNDYVDASLGGNDTLLDQAPLVGSVIWYLGAAFTANDKVNTGTLILDGDYFAGVVCNDTTLYDVSKIVLTAGHSYTIKVADANLESYWGNGKTTVDGALLGASDSLLFDASLESGSAYSMIGGAGSDTFCGGAGHDSFSGGAGDDTLDYSGCTVSVRIDLNIADWQAITDRSASGMTWSQYVQLNSIENLTGSAFDDHLNGDANTNVLNGGAGNDTLDGGGGYDKAVFGGNSSAYTVTYNPDGSTTVVGTDGTDTLRNIEELDFDDTHIPLASTFVGTAGNDTLTGTAYNDTFDLTQGGDDTASGLGGADVFTVGAAFNAADRIDGGTGLDTVQLDGDYAGGLTLGATTMVNIETLIVAAGHSYAITSADATVAAGQSLTVNASALGAGNALNFNGAAETDGSFVFIAGGGNDVLRGGAGSDTVDYSGAAGAVTVNLATTTAQAVGGGQGSDTLSSVENLTGSGYADTLIGDGNNNILVGGGGADSLRPGMGSDTVSGGNGDDTISFTGGRFDAADAIDGGAGTDLLWLSGDYSGGVVMNAATLTNVENIAVAAGFNYRLTTADTTVGAGKALSIDTTSLGASNTLYFDGSAETDGSFTLLTGAGADTLIGGGGGDTFRSGGGFDHVSGNGGNDTISFSLGHLDAADVIDGGSGTDMVWLNSDYTGANAVTFNATTLTNVETIALSSAYSFNLTTADATVGAGKTLTVDGSSLGASKTLTFNGAAETDGSYVVIGGAGGDTLTGGAGNDTLSGRAGNDTLNAGFGNDVVSGGDGNDTISFTNGKLSAADIIDGGTGTDTVWLNGDYTGANAVTFNSTTITNVESIGFAAGFSYSLKSSDGTVAAGKTLTIDASTLGVSNVLTFDGSAETNGSFVFVSGSGADNLKGGSGADTFQYDAASRSSGLNYDTINTLNFANDTFDLASNVTAIDAAKTSGSLSTASFDSDLTSRMFYLGAHHAILFTPNAGTLAGQTFMVIDCNGTAGYQSGQDMAIRLNGYSGTLTTGAFH